MSVIMPGDDRQRMSVRTGIHIADADPLQISDTSENKSGGFVSELTVN